MNEQTIWQRLCGPFSCCCCCTPLKVHMLVARETFQAHETFMEKLNLQTELCSAESCDVILLFCPVISQIGTDMEADMDRVPANKPVILVFMHHCHHPSHMTNITVQPSRSNIVQVVHCSFHQYKGLLQCQENEQAVDAVRSALLRYDDSQVEVPQSKVPHIQSEEEQPLLGNQESNWPNITDPAEGESESGQRKNAPAMEHSTGSSGVKVHTLVAGQTFQAHETFMQKLKLQIQLCSAESCNVILLFCPVVSRIGTDMEAAMSSVTENKPVILVFMHHCHNPSHMTNITMEPAGSNIVQVVHCTFHESVGLLECQENEQAVKAVTLELKKYKKTKAT